MFCSSHHYSPNDNIEKVLVTAFRAIHNILNPFLIMQNEKLSWESRGIFVTLQVICDQYPEKYGRGFAGFHQTYHCGVDTEITHVVADVTNTKCITVLNDRPVIGLYVVIKNSVTINLLHHSRIHLNEHATNVLYDPAGKHDIVFPGKGNYEVVIFHFPVTYVHRLMEFYPELQWTLQTGIDSARPAAVLGEKKPFCCNGYY